MTATYSRSQHIASALTGKNNPSRRRKHLARAVRFDVPPKDAYVAAKLAAVAAAIAPRFLPRQLDLAYLRQGGKCCYCGKNLWLERVPGHFKAIATRDHFMPTSRGGARTDSNVVCCCGACNSRKSDQDPYLFTIKMFCEAAPMMQTNHDDQDDTLDLSITELANPKDRERELMRQRIMDSFDKGSLSPSDTVASISRNKCWPDVGEPCFVWRLFLRRLLPLLIPPMPPSSARGARGAMFADGHEDDDHHHFPSQDRALAEIAALLRAA